MASQPTAWVLTLSVALLLGCGGGGTDEASTPDESQPAGTASDPAASGEKTSSELPPPPPPSTASDESPAPAGEETPAATEPAGPGPDMVAEPAMPGVGAKGRDYGTGPVATPIAAMFRTQQRIKFIEVAHALKMYKAINGHSPKSHEEFMREIIQRNGLKLPTLPPGHEYFYDAEVAAKIDTVDPSDPDRMPLMVLKPR
jgi:hypothetical protein